jgi:hypothetical protein
LKLPPPGLGGIFMSAKDPKALCDWYKKHLGIDVQDWGGAASRPSWSTIESKIWQHYSPGGPTSNPSLNGTPNSRLRRLSVAG